MKITYIAHSGVAFESEGALAVVDFYRDAVSAEYPDGFVRHLMDNFQKPLYVLSTHSHHDHFNPEILEWRNARANVKYVFSSDILKDGLAKAADAAFLKKTQEFEDANIFVKAFGSTDKGVSFFMCLGGKKLFHAGDFNEWHWELESTPKEIATARKYFLRELKPLAEYAPQLDFAAFPIDPRMGQNCARGAEEFLKGVKVSNFMPVHFWGNYSAANEFEYYARAHSANFMKLGHEAQSFEI